MNILRLERTEQMWMEVNVSKDKINEFQASMNSIDCRTLKLYEQFQKDQAYTPNSFEYNYILFNYSQICNFKMSTLKSYCVW